ncbi:BTB/POZ domain-containing protein [Apostasia shenzhenica]|uniref:BTB/POZ domain-containing protein n=1 Tax=Apostasia shenzhenica TaxID=1088818 RepID=A0A2I0ALM9_9ASPA|nr:BTB/POZ domain-containing protein [Apostasia shenzhenica]
MPPFDGAATGASCFAALRTPEPAIVTLNVGGQIFHTTTKTLAAAGPSSILSSPPPFIDRDPDLFAVLLSLLCSGRFPSSFSSGDRAAAVSDLATEAAFYGIDHRIVPSALSSFSSFSPLSLRRSLLLSLPGREPVSALSAAPSGEIVAAHGSKITYFDFSLRHKKTLLTSLPAVDSVLSLPQTSLAAAGAGDFPGLQILDFSSGTLRKTLHWHPHPSVPGAAVQAVAAAGDRNLLFSSYESCRRNASAIVAFDLGHAGDFCPVSEIGRREIYGAELESAIPATKLKWVSSLNLLMAAGSHWGPSGVVGSIRLWDIRAGGTPIWDFNEKVDCFADVTASGELSAMFKVGVSSGEILMADLRRFKAEDPWVGIGVRRRKNGENVGKKEGKGCRIESEGRQVFCSRGGEVEMWSEVAMAEAPPPDEKKVMRRNVLGRAHEKGGGRILLMGFGGKRMAVGRSGESSVEVWEN